MPANMTAPNPLIVRQRVRTEIEPGQGVAVFTLPLPMNGIAILNDAIERIYGTGKSMLSFKGDQIQVNAPAEGFGPVKKRKSPTPAVSDDGATTHMKLRDETFEVTLEQAQDIVTDVMSATRLWFTEVGGINYVEFKLEGTDHQPQPYYFCVQRAGGKSPHDLRLEADARLAKINSVVQEAYSSGDYRDALASIEGIIDNPEPPTTT